MTRRDDPTIRAIRAADPGADPEVATWPESEEAAAVADRVRAGGDGRDISTEDPRGRPRRIVILAAALVATTALAAAIAVRSRDAELTSLVGCHDELSIDSGPVFASAPDGMGPVEACRRDWPTAFGTAIPARLVACVLPEGGLVVYPLPEGRGAAEACSSVGAARYSPGDGD